MQKKSLVRNDLAKRLIAWPSLPQRDFVVIHANAVGSREGWVKSLQTLYGADPLHPHAQILFPGKS